MIKTVILIGDGMRSGKDELCGLLLNQLPNFKRAALADKVKEMSAFILGVSIDVFNNLETKAEYRKWAIFCGQMGRLFEENYWINQITPIVKTNNTILTDVRFENEMKSFAEMSDENHKIYKVKIKASDETRIARGAQPEYFNDPTETSLNYLTDDDFDFVVDNNSSYANLEKQAIELAKEIVKE